MALYSLFTSRASPRRVLRRQQRGLLLPPLSPLVCVVVIVLTAVVMVVLFLLGTTKLLRYRTLIQKPIVLVREEMVGRKNHTAVLKTLPDFEAHKVRAGAAESNWKPVTPPTPSLPHLAPLPSASHQLPLQLQMMRNSSSNNIVMGPYHNWELFSADYQEMLLNLKIFVYPDVHSSSSKANRNSSSQAPNYDSVFLPLANPTNPKLGNYYSEHAFKVALLHSSLVTDRPEEANFFFMPFSINAMRNHPLLHSASSISDFIAQYTTRISSDFTFWNASDGADHFYVCCHSIGRDAASKHLALHNNAIQVTCSSSYFQRLYITHKDIGLPQVWPRRRDVDHRPFNPPAARYACSTCILDCVCWLLKNTVEVGHLLHKNTVLSLLQPRKKLMWRHTQIDLLPWDSIAFGERGTSWIIIGQ